MPRRRSAASVDQQLEGDYKLKFPPWRAVFSFARSKTGNILKMEFGPGCCRMFKADGTGFKGCATRFDPFGYQPPSERSKTRADGQIYGNLGR